jgi:outer membrane protein TolC
MIKYLIRAAILLQAALFFTHLADAAQLPIKRIAVVTDGPSERFALQLETLKKELFVLTETEFDVRFPPGLQVDGRWNLETIEREVERLSADPRTDILIPMGPYSTHAACRLNRFPKPVVAPFVIDAKIQDLPRTDKGTSGVKNLCYIDSFSDFEADIQTFRRIVPFHRLVVLADRLLLNQIPELHRLARRVAHEYTIGVAVVPVSDSAEKALALLPPDVDAVYVTPLTRFSKAAFSRLVSGLIRRKLPSFSMAGKKEVSAGLLACRRPAGVYKRLLRRIALNVQRIFLGEDPGDIGVGFRIKGKLTINMKTARAVGLYPSWDVLTAADLIHAEKKTRARKINLTGAVTRAVEQSLTLAAGSRNLLAGKERINEADSNLLPQFEIGVEGAVIDDDRAAASFGAQAERTVSANASITQLLYSEEARAKRGIERRLQDARVREQEDRRLDVILDTALAYLNLLKADTFERIRKENLAFTEANLERARVRRSIGSAAPSEVYRWESEVATQKKEVIAAEAKRAQAAIQLNRMLRVPLETVYQLEETSLTDPALIVGDARFYAYVDNPRNFRIFRNFMVEKGISRTPVRKRLLANIAAKKRELLAARRKFFVPEIALKGEVTRKLSESGAGTDAGALGAMFPLPRADDTEWSIGLRATLPIFEGGGKPAAVRRLSHDLAELKLRLRQATEETEEAIRLALFETKKSYPAIDLAREAARAAGRNRRLVTDAYGRGVVSIIELLDAQNAALVAEQKAAGAVFEFLSDLMKVHRAVGRFDFFQSAAQREAWFDELKAYFKAAGAAGPPRP